MRWMNPDEVREYVLAEDRAKIGDETDEQPPVWRYRLLSMIEHGALQSIPFERNVPRVGQNGAVSQTFKSTVDVGATERRVLLACCVGVEHLRDEDGRTVEYPASGDEAAKLRFWAGVPPAVRTELANAFSDGQVLTEKDRRDFSSRSNSDGPGASSTAGDARSGNNAPATALARE